MKATLKGCAIAVTLLGAVALAAPPASANSLHNEGNFGGTWSRIAPSSSYGYRRHTGRVAPLQGYYGGYAYAPYYRAPYYGPGYYGPGVAVRGPGFGVGVGIY